MGFQIDVSNSAFDWSTLSESFPLWLRAPSGQRQFKTLLSLATDKSSEEMVNNLFGIFFATFQMNQIFGNIISTTVIGEGFPSFSEIGNSNASEIESVREKCGLNQVNEPSSCEAGAIDDQTLYLLMGEFEPDDKP